MSGSSPEGPGSIVGREVRKGGDKSRARADQPFAGRSAGSIVCGREPMHSEPRDQIPAAERWLEALLFASRWLMAPFYLGLVVALAALLFVFANELATSRADGPGVVAIQGADVN
jgi:hypothetical protein